MRGDLGFCQTADISQTATCGFPRYRKAAKEVHPDRHQNHGWQAVAALSMGSLDDSSTMRRRKQRHASRQSRSCIEGDMLNKLPSVLRVCRTRSMSSAPAQADMFDIMFVFWWLCRKGRREGWTELGRKG